MDSKHSLWTGWENAQQQAWRSKRITNFDILRSEVSSFSYVVIDCEGKEGHGDGVTSIGLALLPSAIPSQTSVFGTWPWHNVTLDDTVLHYSMRSVSLRVEGVIEEESPSLFDMARLILSLVMSWKSTFVNIFKWKQQKPLVLVAWSIGNEVRAMDSLFPDCCHSSIGGLILQISLHI